MSRKKRTGLWIYSRLQNILLPVQSKIEEARDIDESLNGLEQDDPYLVDVLKNHYLMSPASGPYRIDQNFLRSPLVDVMYLQQVLEYREFDYRDPRNTGIFLMVTINLEYRDFLGKIRIPCFFRVNPNIRG